ncbi:XRE family transcriptional regulator [Pseudomonas sp. App30]|uniref:helix-turn-helix domain-containing protein n=1 Tax=Pseudomonas sp. App30 TaxID=3068990 RepID=UPI003A80B39F
MDINTRIATRISFLRKSLHLSLEALADKSAVSRSMISLIERGQSSPTAVVLEKLATALGVPLSALFEAPAEEAGQLLRAADQLQWRDPQSGYIRRNVSPSGAQSPIQLVEVEFPAGASVAYETSTRDVRVDQQVWLLAGRMDIQVGEQLYQLETGDCLAFPLDKPTRFHNPHGEPARYAVIIVTDSRR